MEGVFFAASPSFVEWVQMLRGGVTEIKEGHARVAETGSERMSAFSDPPP